MNTAEKIEAEPSDAKHLVKETSSAHTMPIWKKLLLSIGFTLFGLILALAVVEAFIRVKGLDKAQLPNWSDRPQEYFYHEVASTLQDWTHSPVKPADVYRIAIVGDSFTFSPYMQADDAFPKRLERWLNLNAQQDKTVEVINYGVPSYSTSHEIAVTQKAIDEGADLVILQITLNDPEIKQHRPTGLGALARRNHFGQPEPDSWLLNKWRTLKFVFLRNENRKSQEKYKKYFFDLWEGEATLKQFQTSLDKIVQLCRQANVPIVAVTFPLFGFPNDENYPFHPIHNKVESELASREVKNLDLFEHYKNIPLDRLVVLPARDRHPNEIANRIAGEAILSWFEKNKLVPEQYLPKKRSLNREGTQFKDNQKPLDLGITQ